MGELKFGLVLPSDSYAKALDFALESEAAGFFSVSSSDHFVSQIGPPDAPQLECFTLLTALASRTSRIRVTPLMASASYRSPAMLAKITTTLDQLSGGRLVLGLGAGWHKAEYEAHGYEFPAAAERMMRLEETIEIVKSMWTSDKPTFVGSHLEVHGASSSPRPVQSPHPPLMLGGSSDRLLDIASRHANIVNLIPPTSGGKDFIKSARSVRAFDESQLRERIAALRAKAAAAGRRSGDIELSSLSILLLTDKSDDQQLDRLASRLGVPSGDAGKKAPVVLMGTPSEVADEIRRRRDLLGITYFVMAPISDNTRRRFADEVMPAVLD